jgi:hypothetical protein
MIDNMNTKIEAFIKIVDKTDNESPKVVRSFRVSDTTSHEIPINTTKGLENS